MPPTPPQRPAFATADDGCGNYWWERGRLSAWINLREWVIGIEVHPDEISLVVLRLGPVWIAWELGT